MLELKVFMVVASVIYDNYLWNNVIKLNFINFGIFDL